ncbi:hypothetical protein KUCAC02_034791 [Chaenocephalus aceratus]|nr:hypothetical protein KUCAC02_034791 [Chaenocephalus aceratus]
MEAVLLALLPGCSASCLRLSPSLSPPPLVLRLDSGSTTELLPVSTDRGSAGDQHRARAHHCARPRHHAHKRSPGGKEVEEEVFRVPAAASGSGGGVQVLTSPLIPGCFGHGFSTRAGGVSAVALALLSEPVSSSRRRDSVSRGAGEPEETGSEGWLQRPDLAGQGGPRQCSVGGGGAEPERYDAMVTDQRGRVLAAPGADCMPLLFADRGSKVIGAAHAGWKGTLECVAMADGGSHGDGVWLPGEDIVVCRGATPRPRRPHVNIRLANRILLERGGVQPGNIDDSSVSECTSCHTELFFSHVRDGLNFGTQLGFLWIREEEEGETDE